jgi:hypothetical protein
MKGRVVRAAFYGLNHLHYATTRKAGFRCQGQKQDSGFRIRESGRGRTGFRSQESDAANGSRPVDSPARASHLKVTTLKLKPKRF